jgi:hypothetical protein
LFWESGTASGTAGNEWRNGAQLFLHRQDPRRTRTGVRHHQNKCRCRHRHPVKRRSGTAPVRHCCYGLGGIKSTANMHKRKKHRSNKRHRSNFTYTFTRISRRFFGKLGLSMLTTVLVDQLKRLVPFLNNAPVPNDPRVVTIKGPTIGPTAQTFPPTVTAMAPLRINVSSSVLFVDAFETKSPSAS